MDREQLYRVCSECDGMGYVDYGEGDERCPKCGSSQYQGLVPVEIDYEAVILERHRYGRPKCYEALDGDGCYCRQAVMKTVAAFGLGGDDER